MNESSTSQFTAASGRRFTAAALVLSVLSGGLVGAAAIWLLKNDPATAATTAEETAHKADLPQGVVEISEAAQKNASLEVVRADTQVLPAVIDVTGVVAPVESRVAHIRPLAHGLIEKVSVSLGARVQAGPDQRLRSCPRRGYAVPLSKTADLLTILLHRVSLWHGTDRVHC